MQAKRCASYEFHLSHREYSSIQRKCEQLHSLLVLMCNRTRVLLNPLQNITSQSWKIMSNVACLPLATKDFPQGKSQGQSFHQRTWDTFSSSVGRRSRLLPYITMYRCQHSIMYLQRSHSLKGCTLLNRWDHRYLKNMDGKHAETGWDYVRFACRT